MSNSDNLAIQEVGENQNNKYITINDAIAALESVTQDYLPFAAVGAGPVNLTDFESTRYMFYEVSGGSAAFNLVFKRQNVDAASLRRFMVINNKDTTYPCTVKTDAGGTPLTVVLPPGRKALIQQKGDDIIGIGFFNDLLNEPLPYDLAIFIEGTTTNNQLCFQFTASRPFRFVDDFVGSDANVGVNPTVAAVFTIQKNGTPIGSLTFTTGGVPVFATTGSGYETFAAGDILRIVSQAVADTTMADISISLKGERT